MSNWGDEPNGLATLLTALRSISAALDRQQVIEQALSTTLELLGARVATLRLASDRGEQLFVARRVGPRVLVSIPEDDERGAERAANAALACVELRLDELTSGRLRVEADADTDAHERKLGLTPVELLEAIAEQLAVSLRNAELHAEQRAAEQQVWSILDNSNSTVFIKDLDGRYILVNEKLVKDTGLTREQILGRTDEQLFDAATAARIRADDRQVIESGELAEFEGVTQFPSGPRIFSTTKFPLRDRDGRIYALCGISTDISARRQAEHSHRLDALGQLAGESARPS